MSRKIIFLDIDGTLTESGTNEPPSSALWAIDRARAAGHYIFLCSGRCYGMLKALLQYNFDGVVASAGGYIVCGGEVIFDCPMEERQRKAAMALLKGNGVFRTVECLHDSYTDMEFREFLGRRGGTLLRHREQTERNLNIRPMQEYRGQPVYKIVFMSPAFEQLTEPRRLLLPDFDFVVQEDKGRGYVQGELINRKFDKGRAIKRVCECLKIPQEDSVAFGDSMNDREMLESAGLGICMGNGSQELKRIADDVCPSLREDGIRDAFLKHGLL